MDGGIAAGLQLGEFTSDDGGATWTLPTAVVPAASVTGASVVVNGGPAITTVTSPVNP